jgi:hypothetical protein
MAFMRNPLYILMQEGKVRLHNKGYGMVIDQAAFDMIVMMRYYNMTDVERRAAIDLAIATQAETGADGVRKAVGLTTVQERVHKGASIRNWPADG